MLPDETSNYYHIATNNVILLITDQSFQADLSIMQTIVNPRHRALRVEHFWSRDVQMMMLHHGELSRAAWKLKFLTTIQTNNAFYLFPKNIMTSHTWSYFNRSTVVCWSESSCCFSLSIVSCISSITIVLWLPINQSITAWLFVFNLHTVILKTFFLFWTVLKYCDIEWNWIVPQAHLRVVW